MRGNITWAMAICLTVLSLLASCSSNPSGPATVAPGVSPGATATSTPAASGAKPGGPTAASSSSAASAAPKYGGTLDLIMTNDPLGFDPGIEAHFNVPTLYLTNDELLIGDWSKGPAGTKQFSFIWGSNSSLDSKTGSLAESWKMVAPGHYVFNIRHGVHFALNPNSAASRLVNGRELTAADVVASLKREVTIPGSFVRGTAPDMVKSVKITAPDKWTVDIQVPPLQSLMALSFLAMGGNIIAPEVVQKYGNLKDWRNSVGTGPFILTDYTSGSQLSFVKNANYWGTDPVGAGKGNKLPYLDGVRISIIPDPSTQMTALRTGKIDWLSVPPQATAQDLLKTVPQLKSERYMTNANNNVFMQIYKPNLPYHHQRVRQALTMAIDYKTIVSTYLSGDAEYPGFPTLNIPDYKSIYFPLSQAPQAVQDLYSYNPTKAKQLLADAGYPNGFKASIVVNSTGGLAADDVSVIKQYWDKIGVDLSLVPTENGLYQRTLLAKSYPELIYGGSGSHGIYIRFLNWDGGGIGNGSNINEPYVRDVRTQVWTAWANGDEAKADQIYTSFEKYAMEKAWVIPFPAIYNYTFWWPYLENYHGELNVGFDNGFAWTKWVWLDQGLKKQMLGGQ